MKKVIKELELSLLNPSTRQSSEKLNQLLSEDFLEIGQSGVKYNKKDIINYLPLDNHSAKYTIHNFEILKLSEDIILATYLFEEESAERKYSLRSSVWKKNNNNWQLTFHQGTKLID